MGLDMFLWGKKSLYDKDDDLLTIDIKDFIKEMEEITPVSVTFEIGYWRKVNHVHNWFVKNVQNGEDDCEKHWVTPALLEELLKICKVVMKHKDEKVSKNLLPTQSGAFFGGYDYDEYYYDGVELTIRILNRALKYKHQLEFYYQSSW